MATLYNIGAASKTAILVEEGKVLSVVGDPNSSGMLYKLSDSSGTNANQSYTLTASGTQKVGPFDGTVEFLLVAIAGNFTATVASAWTSAPSFLLDANNNPIGLKSLNGNFPLNPGPTGATILRTHGSIIAEGAPNTTLLDTSASAGTTATQIGFATIPGGIMGPRTRIEVHCVITGTGGNGKTTALRIGPASGSYATATGFSGQSGLTSQAYMAITAMVWNNGSLASQFVTPPNINNYQNTGSAATALLATAVDTSLDWNIYFGVQMGLLNGGDSMTLRHYYVKLIG